MPDITYDVGRVSFVMKGAWNLATNYEKLDAVSYNGSLYIAKQDVPGGTAITNTTYWQLAAEKGDKGDTGGVDSVNGQQGDVWFPDSRQLISDGYTTDTAPFLMKGNDSGSDRFELTKRGDTVGLNQLWGKANGTISANGITITFDKSANELTVIVSSAPTGFAQFQLSTAPASIIPGRPYIIASDRAIENGMQFYASGMTGIRGNIPAINQFTIETATSATSTLYFYVAQATTPGTYKYKLQWRDLDVWYGNHSRVPSDLLSHPEKWGEYYAGSLDFEPGRLESADGTKLTSFGTDGVTVLTEVDTGGEVLHSALDVADEKAHSGIITKKVGALVTLDLSTMTFTQESGGGTAQWYSTDQPFASYKKPATNADRANAQSGRFPTLAYTGLASNSGFGITSTGRLGISNDIYTNRASYTSVEFFCEAATPTTEQGTAFEPLVATVKNGVLSWTNTKGIPVGHESHWFENLRKRVEDRLPDPPSADGTYRLTCTISGGVKTYSWEA